MNTEQYFKDEFQAYPEIMRELVSFFSSNAVVEALQNPERAGFDDALRGKLVKTMPGGLYVVEGYEQMPGQKSAALAKWAFLAKKDTVVCTWVSPLIKQDRYAIRREQWSKCDSLWLTWLVAINIQQKIWGLHKASESYQQLSEEGKHLVELVGSAMKVVRKRVSFHLLQRGLDLSSSANQLRLKAITESMIKERVDKARCHLELLPEDFKKSLFSYLRGF